MRPEAGQCAGGKAERRGVTPRAHGLNGADAWRSAQAWRGREPERTGEGWACASGRRKRQSHGPTGAAAASEWRGGVLFARWAGLAGVTWGRGHGRAAPGKGGAFPSLQEAEACASFELLVIEGYALHTTVPAGLSRKQAELFAKLDPERLPQHIAVIMDGNGRWAQRRHLPRIAGHKQGVEAVRDIITLARASTFRR